MTTTEKIETALTCLNVNTMKAAQIMNVSTENLHMVTLYLPTSMAPQPLKVLALTIADGVTTVKDILSGMVIAANEKLDTAVSRRFMDDLKNVYLTIDGGNEKLSFANLFENSSLFL